MSVAVFTPASVLLWRPDQPLKLFRDQHSMAENSFEMLGQVGRVKRAQDCFFFLA